MENFTWTTTSSSNNEFNYSSISLEFRMYVEPVLCVVSVLGNIAVLFGMARVKHGFSISVRFYYKMMAIAGLVLVSCFYFVGDFLEQGIAHLVSGGAFYPIRTLDAANWSCKLLNALWMGPDNFIGLTLVCLGIERVIAVTWPIHAKRRLTLRFSVLLETTVNSLVLVGFLTLLCIDYKIDPQYGCWYDFSLPFTQFYIMLEETIPIIRSFISFGISIYLVVTISRSMIMRRHISSGGGISASEMSNVATLMVFDVVSLIVFIPTGIIFWIYSFTLINPSAFSADFTLIIYQLGDLSGCLMLIPHTLIFFIHFSRSGAFRKALFGKCFERKTI